MSGNRRQNPKDPKFPLLQYPLPVRDMTIQCMSPMQLVNYSFSSKEAAQAVRQVRIQVDLMEIYLYGLRNRSSNPQNEQGIELTFSGHSGESVLFWFASTNSKDQVFHKKVTIDGYVLRKCYTKSYKDQKHLACFTQPNVLVTYLKKVEAHFRSVFRIQNTNVDLNGDLISKYRNYGDLKKPMVVNNLRVNTEIEPGMEQKLRVFNPSYLQLDLIRLPRRELEITADVIEYGFQYGELNILHLKDLDARQIEIISFVDEAVLRSYIGFWHRKDLEKLEVFKCAVTNRFDRAHFLNFFSAQRFDRVRRPATKKVIDGDGKEKEVDLSNGMDILRADGRVATVHFDQNKNRITHFWFVVWPKN